MERLEFVHQSQFEQLCVEFIFRCALVLPLPLRLPQHFPQYGTSWLGGKESVVKRRVLVRRAELKSRAGGGKGGRFRTRRVGRGAGLEDEAFRTFSWHLVFPPPLSGAALLLRRSAHRRRGGADVKASVPAQRVVDRGRNAALQQEAHQPQGRAGRPGGVPQVGGGLCQGQSEGVAPWGAAGGVGRRRWRREGHRRGGGSGRADGSAALTGGSSWAGGRRGQS